MHTRPVSLLHLSGFCYPVHYSARGFGETNCDDCYTGEQAFRNVGSHYRKSTHAPSQLSDSFNTLFFKVYTEARFGRLMDVPKPAPSPTPPIRYLSIII